MNIKKLVQEEIQNQLGLVEENIDIDKLGKDVYEYTDRNDVYGAWIELMTVLKNKELVRVFEALDIVHNYQGYLTGGLDEARKEVIEKAKKFAEYKLGKEDWKRVYNKSF